MEIDTGEIFEKVVENLDLPNQKSEVENFKTINKEMQNNVNSGTDFYYDEEELVNEYEKDFSYQIRERGYDYYHSNNIINVYKNKNRYVAKVRGTNSIPYDVTLEVHEDHINYNCTCPCTYPCKHEYAVLLAISNAEYAEIELKNPIKEKEANLKAVIQSIPADELKAYLLSPVGLDKVIFEMDAFSEYFRKYYPTQKYEFYYNNLYNSLVLNDDYTEKTESYLTRVKQYIAGSYFDEVLNIIKAIINAYQDTNKLNFDDNITDILPRIGMFLRVAYRKSDNGVREEIDKWIIDLEKENFYNNYYLEDIMLSIK